MKKSDFADLLRKYNLLQNAIDLVSTRYSDIVRAERIAHYWQEMCAKKNDLTCNEPLKEYLFFEDTYNIFNEISDSLRFLGEDLREWQSELVEEMKNFHGEDDHSDATVATN